QIHRLQFHHASRVFFKFLYLHFRFRQLVLANFHQPGAFFILCQQCFQRQIVGLHGLDNALQLLQSFLERRIFHGRTFLPRALCVVRHGCIIAKPLHSSSSQYRHQEFLSPKVSRSWTPPKTRIPLYFLPVHFFVRKSPSPFVLVLVS